MSDRRAGVIETVADQILSLRRPDRTFLVGIDGIDGAGKTRFADELGEALDGSNARIVRSTVDSFHNPRSIRWSRGRNSPLGFFLDSHDLDALSKKMLEPFRNGEGDFYQPAIFDEPSDQPIDLTPEPVLPGSILIFDGIFLQRSELAEFWDLTIFLDGQSRVALRRLGLVSDGMPDGAEAALAHVLMWTKRFDRYVAGMGFYMDLINPIGSADIVIDNNDFANPWRIS